MQPARSVMDGTSSRAGRVASRERLVLAGVFAAAALRYWLTRLPGRRSRARALAPARRRDRRPRAARPGARRAGQAREHRGRGRVRRVRSTLSAASWCFAPWSLPDGLQLSRTARRAARAPTPLPTRGRLHEALLVALDPAARRTWTTTSTTPSTTTTGISARWSRLPRRARVLPSYAAVAPLGAPRRRADRRVPEPQHRRLPSGDRRARWSAGRARDTHRPAAACSGGRPPPRAGSSLGVHALIAAARPARGWTPAQRRGGRARLLPLDRRAALAARQPRRPSTRTPAPASPA